MWDTIFGLYIVNGKRLLIILLLGICIITSIFSQTINSFNYYKNLGDISNRNTENFLIFNENQVFFNLTTNGFGLITDMTGKGSYKIKKDKIIIYTMPIKLNSVTESYYSFTKNKNNNPSIYKFSVRDKKSEQFLPFANIIFFQINGEINGKQAYPNGECELIFSEIPKDSVIRISHFGYQSIDIKIENLEGGTFDVYLAEGALSIIQNKKIYLKYKIDVEDILIKYFKEEDIPNNWIRLSRKK